MQQSTWNKLQLLRYAVFLAIAFILNLIPTIHKNWYGDFWDHAATIRELSTHFTSPLHPLFPGNYPHPLVNPYTVAATLISKATHLDSIAILSVLAMVNLLLLFAGMRLFAGAILRQKPNPSVNANSVCVYWLLLTVFYWGRQPLWHWSGFFHFQVFHFTMPYPSASMTALSLFCFYLYLHIVEKGNKYWFIALGLLMTIILLSHPFTAGFLFLGLFALFVTVPTSAANRIGLSASIACIFIAAGLWPYFPFYELVFSEGKWFIPAFHNTIYDNFLWRTYPSLVVIPIIIKRFIDDRRDPLVLMFALLGAVCLYGYIARQWTYGRLISHFMLIAHLMLAIGLTQLETAWIMKLKPAAWKLASYSVIILFLALCIWRSRYPLRYILEAEPNYKQYYFLARYVNQYDVVLTDFATAYIEPAFGGKVLAIDGRPPFIPNYLEQQSDVAEFFKSGSTKYDRERILKKYHVRFILLNSESISDASEILDTMKNETEVIHSEDGLTLLKVQGAS